MMIPIHWRNQSGEINSFMININEYQPLRELGLKIRKIRWTRERKGTRHHALEIVLMGSQLKMNAE
jgi:hypothetical protein